MSNNVLKLGIPAGSLQKATIELFDKAGFAILGADRNYLPRIDDEQIEPICLRAQEMSRYVADGVLDAGITGYDWIMENGSDVVEVCELAYSKQTSNPARWVLAVPNESKVKNAKDLAGGIIATELVKVVEKYFAEKDVKVKVEFSWGATEVKARLIDAIVELTETGTSLRANNLRIIDTVITSTTRLIANKQAWEDKFKREKIAQHQKRRPRFDTEDPAGRKKPDRLPPGRRELHSHRGHHRRKNRTNPCPRPEACRSIRHYHLPAQQGHTLTIDSSTTVGFRLFFSNPREQDISPGLGM